MEETRIVRTALPFSLPSQDQIYRRLTLLPLCRPTVALAPLWPLLLPPQDHPVSVTTAITTPIIDPNSTIMFSAPVWISKKCSRWRTGPYQLGVTTESSPSSVGEEKKSWKYTLLKKRAEFFFINFLLFEFMSIYILLCYIIRRRHWLWPHLSGYHTNTHFCCLSSAGFFSFVVVNSWKGPIKLKRIVRGEDWRGWRRKKKIREETQISFVAFYLDYGFLWKFVSCLRRYIFFSLQKEESTKFFFFFSGMVAIWKWRLESTAIWKKFLSLCRSPRKKISVEKNYPIILHCSIIIYNCWYIYIWK